MPTKPPFLFRCASAQSRGTNTPTTIDPLAGYESFYHPDVASFSLPTLSLMVYDHIKYIYDSPSEFSSWSVSLLYVLMHAVRKTYSEDEQDVLVYVMDTRSLPASRIHSAVELIKQGRIDWAPNLTEYAQGEYLIHGKLEHEPGLWQAVKFDDLVTAGLKKAFPSLQDTSRQHLLFQRVLQLRIPYFRRLWESETAHLTIYRSLAKCFNSDFRGLVMLALIAIRRRDMSEEGMETIEAALESMQLPRLPWATSISLRSFHMTLGSVPEAQQLMQLLRLLYDRGQARERETKEAIA